MKGLIGRAGVIGMSVTLSAFSAGTAAAQWHATAIGVAEYDTKQTWLALGGVSASPSGMGVAPIVGVQAYELGFANGIGRTYVFTVQPYVGLGDNYNGGEVAGTLGYAWANNTVSAPVSTVTGDQGKGVVLSGSWDHWGTGGPTGYQLLGSYNFGSKSLWTRGRVTQRISPPGPTQRRVGFELAYLEGQGFSAYQPGAVLEFHDAQNRILGLGAGMKFFGNGGGNAVYFKVEGVLPLGR